MTKKSKRIITYSCIAVFVVLVFIVSCALINTDFYNKIKNYSLLQRVFISAKSLVLSSYTVITIAFSVADVLVLFFWGKELNKEKHLFFSLILFTLLCIWHTIDLIRPSNSLHLWLFVITYSIISTILILRTQAKNKPTIEERLVLYAKSQIKGWSGKVACFEVYSVKKRQTDDKAEYSIDYVDGCWHSKTSLNAILTSKLIMELQDLVDFDPFFSVFYNATNGKKTIPEKGLLEILSTLSSPKINSLKEQLSMTERKDTSTSIDECCKCRLINVFLGCIDSIEKNHWRDYIGYECASINIQGNWAHTSDQKEKEELNLELNDRLYTDYRTGLLGAILLPKYAFSFNYEQKKHSYKANREYVAFTLRDLNNHDSSPLVLITIEGTLKNAIGTVNSIKAKCFSLGKE